MVPNRWRKSSLKKAGLSAFSKEKTQPAVFFPLSFLAVLLFLCFSSSSQTSLFVAEAPLSATSSSCFLSFLLLSRTQFSLSVLFLSSPPRPSAVIPLCFSFSSLKPQLSLSPFCFCFFSSETPLPDEALSFEAAIHLPIYMGTSTLKPKQFPSIFKAKGILNP